MCVCVRVCLCLSVCICLCVCVGVCVGVTDRPSDGDSLGEARTHLKQDFYPENGNITRKFRLALGSLARGSKDTPKMEFFHGNFT